MTRRDRATRSEAPGRVSGPASAPSTEPAGPATRAAAELDRAIEAAGTRLAPGIVEHPFPPSTVLRLQRVAGNRGVVALLAGTAAQGRRPGRRGVPVATRRIGGRRVVQRDLLDDIGDAVSDTLDAVADTASGVAGEAWDSATEAGGAVAGAATQAWEDAASGAAAVAGAATEVASGVVDAATDVGREMAGAAGEAWDSVTETARDVGGAIADGAVSAFDEATDVASGVIDGVAEIAGSAWDRLADTAGRAASGVSAAAGTVWGAVADGAERVWSGVRETVGSAWDAASDIASGAWDAVTSTAARVAGGIRDLAAEAWDGIKSAAGAAWEAVSGTLGSLWNFITDGVGRAVKRIAEAVPLPGANVQSRPINGTEISYCQRIFGDDIDYGPVVITRGSVMSAGSARATGNAVNLEDRHFKGDTLDLNGDGYGTLVHEMTHVFQYQHNGLGYIPESLWEQLKAWWRTGDRNNAYVYRPLAEAGVPWEQWNVEQQAAAVQDYNIHLSREEAGLSHDATLLDLLRPYVAQMRQAARRPAAAQ